MIQRFKITCTKADLGKLYETIERIKSKTHGNSDVVFGTTSITVLKKYTVPTRMIGKSFEQFYELVRKASRSKISRTKAEEIYANAGNILTIPEIEPIISIGIKTLITQLELYDEQIQSDRFSNAKKLVAFAGLDSVVSQSGRFQNISGRISKKGSPLLRQALFLAANIARMNDDILKQFYDKKRSEGKHHYSASNAIAAKLLRIVYSVLKSNKEYYPQPN